MTKQKVEYAKYLGTKVFSNKKYKIRVKLFEHGLAEAGLADHQSDFDFVEKNREQLQRIAKELNTRMILICKKEESYGKIWRNW